MAESNRQLALAIFESEPAARAALAALAQWDTATGDARLGQASLLAKDGLLSGPLGWGALVLGGMAGGIIGSFMPSNADDKTAASKEGVERLMEMLDKGKVVVALLVEPGEAGAVMDTLRELSSNAPTTEMLR